MGLVEEIKNLRPELNIDPLACFEVLIRGKIDIHKIGPCEGVSSQVAIRPGVWPRKGTGVIPEIRGSQLCAGDYFRILRAPLRDSMRGVVAIAWLQVGTIRRPPVSVCGTVRSIAPRKRFPCTEGADSVDGPAAQNRPHGPLLEAEWNGISGSEDKIVSGVEGGTSPVEARVKEIHYRVSFLARFAAGDG